MRRSSRTPRSASFFRAMALVGFVLGSGAVATRAHADAKTETEAKKADADAMDLWLAADFKGAKGKLEGALKKCGAKCGAELLAALHRDLGVVLITMGDKSKGAKEFEAAVEADAGVTLAKDYLDSPDVKSAWEAAKKGGGGPTAPTSTGAPTSTATPVNPDAEGGLSLDFKVGPVKYVFPVVVATADGLDVETVKVSYKTPAMDKYKTLEAKKEGEKGDKFITQLPCEDTQFQGDIKVYVRAYDSDKNEVDHFGTLKKPAIIHLADKLEDGVEAPTFPGGKEPEKCVDKGDCQPGFPCDKSANKKPQGSGCESDDECDAGLSCVDNENGKKWCYETGAPDTGGPSSSKSPKGGKKLWFGADVQADFLLIGQAADICNDSSWACTKGGQDVGTKQGIPVTQAQPDGTGGGGGKTSGGPARGTLRFFASLDYFLFTNITVGLRAGYALGGNNSSNAPFSPIHAEARVQYFLGKSPLTEPKGFKPFVLASGGYGEFDALVPDIVVVPANAKDTDNPDQCNAAGGRDPTLCRASGVAAYRLAGRGFAAVGVGAWYMLSPKFALDLAIKILLPLPTFSPGIGPEIGLKF